MPTPTLGRKAVLARFFRMLSNFVTSPVGGRSRLMFVTLMILLMSTNGLNVLNSYVSRDFMTAIEQKDRAAC
jgi:putative ATP-binding cassette transporter